MISQKQKELAKRFMSMHAGRDIFVLPNIWDAGSALIFEKQGFGAVATTSAGIAYSAGCPDGEQISIDDLATHVKIITGRINIPLSVDFERGYSEDPGVVKQNAKLLVECGAVGCNIEDGLPNGELSSVKEQIDKIKALAELKLELDLPFVINARTCIFWLESGEESERLSVAIDRANAYAEAGADCIFIPGALNEATVKALVKNINAPVNIILNTKFNDLCRLRELGVRRLSIGSSAARNVLEHTIKLAVEIKDGYTASLINTGLSYDDANNYFDD